MELERAPLRRKQREDAKRLEQDADQTVDFEIGGRHYTFGQWCEMSYEKDTGADSPPEEVQVPFATHVWPEAIYHHVDQDAHGVRFVYQSRGGSLRRGLMPADAFSSGATARSRAAECLGQGVRVLSDKGKEFAYALGRWAEWVESQDGPDTDPRIVYVTDRPGWHADGDVYVNGTQVFGGDGRWHASEEARAIERRSAREGGYEVWTQDMDRLLTTDGLRCALGVALAGPLVARLHPHSFVVHFHGPSSSGKSTGGEIAASVWGTMKTMMNSWYGTSTSKENLAEIADGACLVLDEIGQFGYSDQRLAEVIYNLASDQGKTRSTQSGDLQQQRHWKITAVSTGEISMKDATGAHRKGGQDVRMLDIGVEMGEMTESREHANAIKRAVGAMSGDTQAGVAGDRWAQHLVEDVVWQDLRRLKQDEHARLLEAFGDGSSETDRILQSVALVSVALIEASRVDADIEHHPSLAPMGAATARQSVDWLAAKVTGQRRAKTPNARALKLLWDKIQTHPQHYPTEAQLEQGRVSHSLWGIAAAEGGGFGSDDRARKTGEIYVSESTLKESGLTSEAGVGPRGFLEWCADQGHCRPIGRKRIGGRRCAWYVFDSEDDADTD